MFSGASDSGSSSSSSEEALPNFPPLQSPMSSPQLSREDDHEVEDCSKFSVGDIVWGKIQGFPWWPGKVNALLHFIVMLEFQEPLGFIPAQDEFVFCYFYVILFYI